MERATLKIPFEIHLTASSVENKHIDCFVSLCRKFEGKALLIELDQGEFRQQPMFVKNLLSDKIENVLRDARNLAINFEFSNFNVNRIKIETDSKYAKIFEHTGATYFEWHGKICLDNPQKTLELCKKHKTHLSKNNLKDEQNLRFITLREFASDKIYQQRLFNLKADLEKNKLKIVKETSEYCVYDDNQKLDKGWLPE